MHKIDLKSLRIRVNEYLKLIGFKRNYRFKINVCVKIVISKKFEIIMRKKF